MGTRSNKHGSSPQFIPVWPHLQLCLPRHRGHGMLHCLLLPACRLYAREVQDRSLHHRPRHLHRHVPLLPHLQLLRGGLHSLPEVAPRMLFWFISMIPFCYIVYTLFVGLKEAQERQLPEINDAVKWACYATVISWCTYPIVYLFPVFSGNSDGKAGLTAVAMTSVQIGYTVSDIISKCGVGFLVYRIALAKSKVAQQDDPCGMEGVKLTDVEASNM